VQAQGSSCASCRPVEEGKAYVLFVCPFLPPTCVLKAADDMLTALSLVERGGMSRHVAVRERMACRTRQRAVASRCLAAMISRAGGGHGTMA